MRHFDFSTVDDDAPDARIASAYRSREPARNPSHAAALRARILAAASARLDALRARRNTTAWEYAAGWARIAIPLALAASLILGVAILRSPAPALRNTEQPSAVMASGDIGTVLYGVMAKTVRPRDAAMTLAPSGGSDAVLWSEIAQ